MGTVLTVIFYDIGDGSHCHLFDVPEGTALYDTFHIASTFFVSKGTVPSDTLFSVYGEDDKENRPHCHLTSHHYYVSEITGPLTHHCR